MVAWGAEYWWAGKGTYILVEGACVVGLGVSLREMAREQFVCTVRDSIQ
jgi:hypothetical protein